MKLSLSLLRPSYQINVSLTLVSHNMFPVYSKLLLQTSSGILTVGMFIKMNHWHYSADYLLFVWIKQISYWSLDPQASVKTSKCNGNELTEISFLILLWLHTFVVIAVCLVRANQLSLTKCWCLWVEVFKNNFLELHQFSCCETSVYAGVRLWVCECVCLCNAS